jgi:uncharacterized membrane protein (DUF485 family)
MGGKATLVSPSVPPDDQPRFDQAALSVEVLRRNATIAFAQPYDRFTAYTNTIVAVGYASFFALWAFTHDQMSTKLNIIAALLMLLSCSVFVLWEVYQMVANALMVRRYSTGLEQMSAVDMSPIEQLAHLDAASARRRAWWWSVQLVISLASGVGAAALMAWSLAQTLVTQLRS